MVFPTTTPAALPPFAAGGIVTMSSTGAAPFPAPPAMGGGGGGGGGPVRLRALRIGGGGGAALVGDSRFGGGGVLVGALAAAGDATFAPHAPQNAAPGSSEAPQSGQNFGSSLMNCCPPLHACSTRPCRKTVTGPVRHLGSRTLTQNALGIYDQTQGLPSLHSFTKYFRVCDSHVFFGQFKDQLSLRIT